jgi:FeS assembly SUF system regulator
VLRITKQTDYGILLLSRLASLPPGRILSARDAARWSGLSMPMASKILKRLARGSIVRSHRGVGGGYSLALPPDRTSLAAVIRALEGPISIVECGAQPGQCEQEPGCPVRVNWARVSREIEVALERVPLTDMLGEPDSGLLMVESGSRRTATKRGAS